MAECALCHRGTELDGDRNRKTFKLSAATHHNPRGPCAEKRNAAKLEGTAERHREEGAAQHPTSWAHRGSGKSTSKVALCDPIHSALASPRCQNHREAESAEAARDGGC